MAWLSHAQQCNTRVIQAPRAIRGLGELLLFLWFFPIVCDATLIFEADLVLLEQSLNTWLVPVNHSWVQVVY